MREPKKVRATRTVAPMIAEICRIPQPAWATSIGSNAHGV